jgi:hypothetical protein
MPNDRKLRAYRQEHQEKGITANTVVKVTAGTGKTSITLDILAARTKGITGHYFAPTHDLAEEVAEKARERGLDAVVIEGRSRPNGLDADGDKLFMCKKHKLAEAVASSGMKVWPSLCEAGEDNKQKDVPPKCEFFDSCDYVQQFEEQNVEGRLLVMAHDWLRLDKSRLGNAQFSIVDERFFDVLITGSNFCLDRITRTIEPFVLASALAARKKGKKKRKVEGATEETEFRPDLAEHAATARKVRSAIEANEHPREHGATLEELEQAKKTEALFVPEVWIAPAMPYYQQQALADEMARGAEARALAWLYELLIESYDWDRLTQQVQLIRNCKRFASDEIADRVFLRSRKAARFSKHAAAVVIDASANVDILTKLMIVTEHHEINAPIQARVVQVMDTECSRGKLLKRGASSKRTVNRIVAFARMKAAEGHKVLVISYKDVIDALGRIDGVDTLHFGKLRGIDVYKGHDVVIIAGRHETDVVNVEAKARAIFGGGSANKLDLPGAYVTGRRRYVTRDGHARFGGLNVHPDPRVQALVEQGREEETLQGLARARLVHRDRPAAVYLLSNMPVPGLIVDEFVMWNALLPNRAEEAAADAGHCDVELLSAAELHRCYPGRFKTAEAAKQWLKRRQATAAQKVSFPYVDSNREVTPFETHLIAYRTAGNALAKRPYSAVVRNTANKVAAERKLQALVGQCATIEHLAPTATEAPEPKRRTVF